MENKNDTAKLAADIEVLKFQIQCLQRENNALMAHIGTTAEKLAGHIDDTNARHVKLREYVIDFLAKKVFADSEFVLQITKHLSQAIDEQEEITMPWAESFRAELAKHVGHPSYRAPERLSAPAKRIS